MISIIKIEFFSGFGLTDRCDPICNYLVEYYTYVFNQIFEYLDIEILIEQDFRA